MGKRKKPIPIDITIDELKRMFTYRDGQLIWNEGVKFRAKEVGKPAGFKDSGGYMIVSLRGRTRLVHRVIWFMHTGENPPMIDHINGNKSDNRIENLRAVDCRANQQNRKEHREGKLLGALWSKRDKLWSSRFVENGKKVHLGTFPSAIAAHEAYLSAISNLKTKDSK